MLSHTSDAGAGIKADYPPEVRITFIPLVPVQWKPNWRDQIALIPLVQSLGKAFSVLLSKEALSPTGQDYVPFYCG